MNEKKARGINELMEMILQSRAGFVVEAFQATFALQSPIRKGDQDK
jgi:hypothetical protein